MRSERLQLKAGETRRSRRDSGLVSWPQTKLEALASDIPYAFVGGPFGSKLTTRDYVESGVPVIRGSNMSGGRYLDTTRVGFRLGNESTKRLFEKCGS